MLGMSKEAWRESGKRFVAPGVEERYKNFGTIAIPFITITLKDNFMFRNFLLLLYKFSGRKYDLEWYTCSGVRYIQGGLI